MASGNTLLVLTPFAATLPAASFAQFDGLAGASTPGEIFPVIAFDGAGADEYADFHLVMPRNYAGGGITITFFWGAAGASNNVIWQAAFRRVADGAEDVDTTSQTYDFNATAATAVPGTQGLVKYTTLTFTDGADMDSVVAGDMFVLRIRRNSGDASDTAAVDAFLHRLELKET